MNDEALVLDRIENPPQVFTVDAVTLTESIAKMLADRGGNPRKLSTARATVLAEQMARGAWMENSDGLGLDVEGHLINGQHRVAARILAGDQGLDCKFVLVSGLQTKAGLYTDTGSKRSLPQAFAAMDQDPRLASSVRVVWAAENSSEGRLWPTEPTYDEMIDYLGDNMDISEAHQFLVDHIDKQRVKFPMSPLVAAMVFCAREDKAAAEEFFASIVDPDRGLPSGTAMAGIRQVLMRYSTRGSLARAQQVSLYDVIVRGFQDHRNGVEVSKAYRILGQGKNKLKAWRMP